MDKESLLKRLKDVEGRFKEQKTAADQELYRLQGEHRLLNDLITTLEADEPQETKEAA